MNIEIGKQYKDPTTNAKATLVHILQAPTTTGATLIFQLSDGVIVVDYNPPRLFTAEVSHYDDWAIDTPILVSTNGKEWVQRHFAGTRFGKPMAFTDGRTSWTVEDTSQTIWNYAKLPEGDK